MSNESTKTNQITEGVIWKQLLIFFFPIVVGTLFQQLYNTVDAVIVGRFVGKGALAAVGGSSAVLSNLIIGCFTGLASGASVIVSQFYGAKDERNLQKSLLPARQEQTVETLANSEKDRWSKNSKMPHLQQKSDMWLDRSRHSLDTI